MTSTTIKSYVVSLSVVCDDPSRMARIAETVSRTATGLSMDGESVTMSFNVLEMEEEGEEG